MNQREHMKIISAQININNMDIIWPFLKVDYPTHIWVGLDGYSSF